MSLSGRVSYGTYKIDYQVIFVDRKTMEIAVHPDCTVEVKAPLDASKDEIEKRVMRRARWIRQQVRYFEQFQPRTPARQYIGGETHLYLGRQYRLRIRKARKESVKLAGRYLNVDLEDRNNRQRIKSLLERWYFDKACSFYGKTLENCWDKFSYNGLVKPSLSVKQMKTRWGSLSKKGTLTLNTDLIRAPRECIEYVIIHECCHLEYYHHNRKFYKLLERTLPGWQKRKEKLERVLV